MIASSMTGEQVGVALARIAAGERDWSTSRPSASPAAASWTRSARPTSTASRSTRPTACRSGGTTSGPTTCGCRTCRKRLGTPPTLALTATATPRVARDIVRRAGAARPGDRQHRLRPPQPVPGGAARRRRGRQAAHAAGAPRRPQAACRPSSTAARRKTCEQVAAHLLGDGISAAPYHAGLPATSARATLGAVPGRRAARSVAATTAFGMGIDKADVRSVVHWTIPSSPEEYYQQAGRAGRDGAPAVCTLLYTAADKGLIAYFIDRAKLTEAQLRSVHAQLAVERRPVGRVRRVRVGRARRRPARRRRRAGAGRGAGAVPGPQAASSRAGWRSRRSAAATRPRRWWR